MALDETPYHYATIPDPLFAEIWGKPTIKHWKMKTGAPKENAKKNSTSLGHWQPQL